MATLAADLKWYYKSGNVVLLQDITEVAVVGSYAPTGNEVVSWNAASEGEIMCHIVGTKLTIVWSDLTEIPEAMFKYFISLEKITGLNAVTVIGKSAFYQCHCLKSVDLIPEKLTKIGAEAFRISSMEDVLDVSKFPSNIDLGARATRKQRWGDELAFIQAMVFPKKRIFLDVANPDSQLKAVYQETPFWTDKTTGEVKTLYNGCSRFVLYHAWNALYAGTDKEYPDMLSWWDATLNADGNYAERTHDAAATLPEDYVALGWEDGGAELVTNSSQLSYILNQLSSGFPVSITIKTSNIYHGILIVGCDPVTRKLAYVDSGAREDRGAVCWVAYEDLFIGGKTTGIDEYETVRKIDFKPPTLAANSTWFTQGGTSVTRTSITEIEIVREYTPTGNETASWDASDSLDGKVMAYVNGTKLTIAGNGYPSVWANSDSSYAFSDTARKDYFANATTFRGVELLNTSKATSMEQMFRFVRVPSLNVSDWNTSNVTKMESLFNRCEFQTIAVDDWDVSSVTTFGGMFGGCVYLKELNLSKWNISNEAALTSMLDGVLRLEKISVNETFRFTDSGLEVPTAEYIPCADGNWYDSDYNAYAPADIPSGVAGTYYASKFLAADDDDTMVFIRNGTLRKMAVAIRHKSGKTAEMYPSAFADEVLALTVS